MNYETFCSEIKENILAVDAVREANAEIIFHPKGETAEKDDALYEFIRSTNLKYFGESSDELMGDFAEISIPDDEGGDKTKFVRLSISTLYDIYQEKGWDSVEECICDNLQYACYIEESASSVIDDMSSYHKIKNKLIIRPLNLSNNSEVLEDYVYKKFGDIALVLYAVVLDDTENNCLNTVKIPKGICKSWNIDEENVILAAMLNTYIFAMPRMYTNIMNIENTPESESAFMSAESMITALKPDTIPLVTTTRKTNGAIALFYPGVKEKIADLFDDSFYVAFTSIHEAMIHKKGTIDPLSIRRHVRATNRTFGPEETLSDNVYFYDREDCSFTPVNI